MDSQKMLELKKWAVVGVTPDPNRFGYKIFKKLKREGYDVYPVNPRYSEIEGYRVYPDLEGLPEIPDVVNLVVKPEVGIEITKKLVKLNVKNLWLQLINEDNSRFIRA
ncbi:MAG: CoA-binding protein [Candidatus Moranbacteria bacterium]|nr:CoA-binding protein [Candidatus Moranbacteria bacterium]